MSSVNGITYKVQTVGDTSADDPAVETNPGGINDFFDDNPLDGSKAQTTDTGGSDPLSDYNIFGAQGADGSVDSSSIDAWLLTFPPTLAELIAARPELINYLSTAVKKFEKAKEDLQNLINQLDTDLASGTLTAAESKAESHTRSLAVAALAKATAQIEECSKQADQRQATWIQEQRAGMDLDGDKWIGQPFVEGSYYVITKDDGTKVYLDVNKKAVPPPMMDPDYAPQLASSDSMDIITKDDVFGTPKEDADLYLKVKESALTSNSNNFNAPIDIGIPEYIWVARDPDSTTDNKADETFNNGSYVMSPYEFVSDGGAIKQNVPDDRSKSVQVKVAKVEISSDEIGTLSGNPAAKLYNTVVTLRDKDNHIIMRIRVDGFEGSGPAATMLDSGVSYVAASTLGFSIHGQDRASAIKVVADQYKSTGRHVLTDTSKLGHGPGDDQGDRAFNENINQFTQKSFTSTKWDSTEGKWVDDPKDFDSGEYAYGEYNDRYVGPDDAPPEGSSYSTYTTGIFLTGLRGDITGTSSNDLIMTSAVDEFSQYAKDHLAKDAQELAFDQPMYNNFINTGNGTDAVFLGKGNNYVKGASLVWGEGMGNDDKNFIVLRSQPPAGGGTGTTTKMPNVKNFVHLDGGTAYIDNPDENGDSALGSGLGAQTPDDITKEDPGMHDDWYEVAGAAYYTNPGDYDVTHCPLASVSNDGGEPIDRVNTIDGAWTDAKEGWDEEFKAIPDLDGELEGLDVDQMMGSQSDLDSEMDSFFNEMFGDFNEFTGEAADVAAEGGPADPSMPESA